MRLPKHVQDKVDAAITKYPVINHNNLVAVEVWFETPQALDQFVAKMDERGAFTYEDRIRELVERDGRIIYATSAEEREIAANVAAECDKGVRSINYFEGMDLSRIESPLASTSPVKPTRKRTTRRAR